LAQNGSMIPLFFRYMGSNYVEFDCNRP